MGNSHIKLSDWIFDDAPETGLTLPGAVVSYWKMDETSGDALDSVGSYTLAESGTVPVAEDGLFSKCRGGFTYGNYLSVDGSSSESDFDSGSGQTYAIDFFMKPYSVSEDLQQIVCPWSYTQGVYYDYDGNNNTNAGATIEARDSSSSANIASNADLDPVPDYFDTWIHVLVAKTGEGTLGTFLLYINGELIDTATGYNFAYPRDFTVGKQNYTSGGSKYAEGIKICDLAWWHDLTSENVPGTGLIGDRLATIAAARYNDGAGQQYIIS